MFCDFFLSRVVGHTAWKDGCTKSKVSELASITDEAFAYLLVENYYEVWTNIDLEAYKNEEIQFDERTRKKKKRKPAWGKYTRNAFGARRYGGWTNEGLLRFNVLHEEVKSDRLKNGEIVDENYKAHCVSSMEYQKRKGLCANAREIVVVDDFDE